LVDCPTTTSSFTYKRMEMAFTMGTTAGSKADRAEAGTGHGQVEETFAGSTEGGSSSNGSW
jgi:hypothetical protein